MKNGKFIWISLILLLAWTQNARGSETNCAKGCYNRTSPVEKKAVEDLIKRLIPQKADDFLIVVSQDFAETDTFQISSQAGKVLITGTRGYMAAAGVHHYLKYFCGCHVSWSGDQLQLPDPLPLPTLPLTITFTDRYRYYQNVCTSSYSYVWWTWDRWQREIDWMALNGINLALAFNAQEYIWTKVFQKFNFTDHDIGLFFTGPAFLAWNRMGNLQMWVGPLNDNWHRTQKRLQHQILERMRSFGITPVLPAFSGRVVPGFNRVYPNASVTVMDKDWGHFSAPYTYVNFLEPTDPLFHEIGTEFLRSYIEEFGTDHIYNADLFNELTPPSTNTSYLKSCAEFTYAAMTAVDPEAIWMIQGWMFFADLLIWQPAQAKAFLQGVPLGKMIVLDLHSELYPQYQRLSSYYGQPFIWCMLHNYGGVEGLYGSLPAVNTGPFEGRMFQNSTMIGTGLTPEGIETNDVVYEFMNEMAWRTEPAGLDDWLRKYSERRYGNTSVLLEKAWMFLKRSVYNATAPFRNHGNYILVRRPSLKLTPYVWYDPMDVFTAWTCFVNSSRDSWLSQSQTFRHDLVDLTRQCLQLTMDDYYRKLIRGYRKKNLTNFRNASQLILELFDDLEEILSSDAHFLLGRWLNSAKDIATTPLERSQYEYNARNQITLWGPSGQILDYANKQWAGLIKSYYKKRWSFFIETLDNCLITATPFNQSQFKEDVFNRVETVFNIGEESYPSMPKGDSVEIAERLLRKYGKSEDIL